MKRIFQSLLFAVALASGFNPLSFSADSGATGKPQLFEGTDTFSYNDCGFQIDVLVEARFLYWQEDGYMKFVSSSFDQTFTNPLTGKSVLLKKSGPEWAWDVEREDGFIEQHYLSRGSWRLIVPGSSLSTVVAGQLHTAFILDPATGEVVDFVTIEDHASPSGLDPIICQLLASESN